MNYPATRDAGEVISIPLATTAAFVYPTTSDWRSRLAQRRDNRPLLRRSGPVGWVRPVPNDATFSVYRNHDVVRHLLVMVHERSTRSTRRGAPLVIVDHFGAGLVKSNRSVSPRVPSP